MSTTQRVRITLTQRHCVTCRDTTAHDLVGYWSRCHVCNRAGDPLVRLCAVLERGVDPVVDAALAEAVAEIERLRAATSDRSES